MMFTKDTRTETFLTLMGVEYQYQSGCDFSKLEQKWSENNIGRPVPIRDEAVLEYATLMESGSPAPAPIVVDLGGNFGVLDGVQRLSAAQLNGASIFSAYVVTTDSDMLCTVIRVLANARLQGRAEPAEWTRKRAVEVLIVERGLSAKEVGVMGGWKASDLERIARIVRFGQLIVRNGGPHLSDAMLTVIAQHAPEKHLEKAAKPVNEFFNILKLSRMSAADAAIYVESFFRNVSPSRVYRTYADRVQEVRDDPEIHARIHGRKVGHLQRDVVFLKALKSAETVAEELVLNGERVANADEFFRLLKSIEKHLRSISTRPEPISARVPADMWSD